MNTTQSTEGYVAFISILMVSVLLLTATLSLAQLSLSQRLFVLNLEYKEISRALATACAEVARIYVMTNQQAALAAFPIRFPVGDSQCTLLSLTPVENNAVLITEAQHEQSYTTLEIITETSSGRLLSWREI